MTAQIVRHHDRKPQFPLRFGEYVTLSADDFTVDEGKNLGEPQLWERVAEGKRR